MRITRAQLSETALPIGQISTVNGSVVVGTTTTAVELLEVTPAGKKPMTASAWANGARFSDSETLE